MRDAAASVEMAVLGCALMGSKAARLVCSKVRADWFYVPAHRELFEVISELEVEYNGPDLVLLKNHLENRGRLKQCGGTVYLVQLMEIVVSARNWRAYVAQLHEQWMRRELRARLKTLAKQIDSGEEPDDLLDAVSALQRGMQMDDSSLDASEINLDSERDLKGVPTGFPSIDKEIIAGGWMASEVSLVLAGTGRGKTSFMLSSVLECIERGLAIGYATYEMPGITLMRRLAKQRCGWSKQPYNLELAQTFDETKKWLQQADLTFFDPSKSDSDDYFVESLCAWAMDRADHAPLDILFVDYAQLLHTRDKCRDQFMVVQTVSRKLKKLAMRTNMPIVLGSQVTVNNGEIQARMSRELENDAGLQLHIQREKNDPSGKLVIRKNRHGRDWAEVPLRWDDAKARYFEQNQC